MNSNANPNQLRYDGKVVVITGAGVGLGRAYAHFYAKRGAKIVVNDIGTSHTGAGNNNSAADTVVNEVKALGAQAVANYDSVEFGEKIIKTAIDTFGRVDILINNAGVLRDVSFKKMTKEDWDLIIRVHLNGVFACTKAAHKYMIEQKSGKIINVSSPAGLYGNFGQVNYSCAKAGIIGFSSALAKESKNSKVYVNVIAPIAATRMTETVLSKDILDKLKVESIVSLVGYLTHDSCTETGNTYEIAGRWVSKLRWQRSEGAFFPENFTPEDVQKGYNNILDFSRQNDYPEDTSSGLECMFNAEEKYLQSNKTSFKAKF
jgi:NAD(P)-dependent dehydrogenase (short-subunit alcohol dehydrogenase family)